MLKIHPLKTLVLGLILLSASFSLYAQDDLKTAQALFEAGNTKQGIAVLMDLLEDTEDTATMAKIQGAIGWGFILVDEFEKAQVYLESSLNNGMKINDQSIILTANNNLGISSFLQNKIEESRTYFSKDFVKDTPTAKTYLTLLEAKENEILRQAAISSGVEHRHNKNFEDAITQYDLALKYKPDDSRTLELKGYSLFRLAKYQAAKETLLLAKDADPSRKVIHLHLLKVTCAMGDYGNIKQVINDSGLKHEVFMQWWEIDGELKKVCANANLIDHLK